MPCVNHQSTLGQFIALARQVTVDEEANVDEGRYVNYYQCTKDGTRWAMTWSCMCDDRCPTCNREIEPYKSEDLADGRGEGTRPRSKSN